MYMYVFGGDSYLLKMYELGRVHTYMHIHVHTCMCLVDRTAYMHACKHSYIQALGLACHKYVGMHTLIVMYVCMYALDARAS
jgi:hypothetical protein